MDMLELPGDFSGFWWLLCIELTQREHTSSHLSNSPRDYPKSTPLSSTHANSHLCKPTPISKSYDKRLVIISIGIARIRPSKSELTRHELVMVRRQLLPL